MGSSSNQENIQMINDLVVNQDLASRANQYIIHQNNPSSSSKPNTNMSIKSKYNGAYHYQ